PARIGSLRDPIEGLRTPGRKRLSQMRPADLGPRGAEDLPQQTQPCPQRLERLRRTQHLPGAALTHRISDRPACEVRTGLNGGGRELDPAEAAPADRADPAVGELRRILRVQQSCPGEFGGVLVDGGRRPNDRSRTGQTYL